MVSIFAEFCESTSAHGFLDFWKATSRVLKIFWALIILISILATFFFVHQVIFDYQNSPLATNILQNYSKEMQIPFAAVCSPTLLNTTKLEEDGFPTETIYTLLKSYNTYSFGEDPKIYDALFINSSMKTNFLRRMEILFGKRNFAKFILKYVYPCEKMFFEVKKNVFEVKKMFFEVKKMFFEVKKVKRMFIPFEKDVLWR